MTNITEIKRANKAAGLHWFEPETLDFFKSRISGEVYEGPGGVYFVTSERYSRDAYASLTSVDSVEELGTAVGVGASLARAIGGPPPVSRGAWGRRGAGTEHDMVTHGILPTRRYRRLYSVRSFCPESGSIGTVGKFQAHQTLEDARGEAKRVAQEGSHE